MKTLMMSTATALIMSTAAFAQTTSPSGIATAYEASDLIGMRLYAGEAEGGVDSWDDIGEINDLMITMDGTVPSAIIGVGGFIGIGEKDVALPLDMIQVAEDGGGDTFLIVKTSAEALEAMPEYQGIDEMAASDDMNEDLTMVDDTTSSDTTPITPIDDTADATSSERDGFTMADMAAIEPTQLEGVTVYTADDENIGEIDTVLLNSNGEADIYIVDVGGFLGLAEKPVALTSAEVSVMVEADGDEMRAYTQATKEVLEAMPEHDG